MGQAAIAVALRAAGELQRGRRDAGLPLRGGILPESPSGERKCTFIRFTLSTQRSTKSLGTFRAKLSRIISHINFTVILCFLFYLLFLILSFTLYRPVIVIHFSFYSYLFIPSILFIPICSYLFMFTLYFILCSHLLSRSTLIFSNTLRGHIAQLAILMYVVDSVSNKRFHGRFVLQLNLTIFRLLFFHTSVKNLMTMKEAIELIRSAEFLRTNRIHRNTPALIASRRSRKIAALISLANVVAFFRKAYLASSRRFTADFALVAVTRS